MIDTADKRTVNTILGREIGSATGWDEWDDFAILLYDFIPNEVGQSLGLLPHYDLVVDWNNGWLISQSESNKEMFKLDMVELHKLPRTEEVKS